MNPIVYSGKAHRCDLKNSSREPELPTTGDRPLLCHVFLGQPNKVKARSRPEIRGMIDRLAA